MRITTPTDVSTGALSNVNLPMSFQTLDIVPVGTISTVAHDRHAVVAVTKTGVKDKLAMGVYTASKQTMTIDVIVVGQ